MLDLNSEAPNNTNTKNMDDRREARRRKILLNSKDRLEKITGRKSNEVKSNEQEIFGISEEILNFSELPRVQMDSDPAPLNLNDTKLFEDVHTLKSNSSIIGKILQKKLHLIFLGIITNILFISGFKELVFGKGMTPKYLNIMLKLLRFIGSILQDFCIYIYLFIMSDLVFNLITSKFNWV